MSLKIYTKEFNYNFKLALPIVLSMLGHTLVGLVDNKMIGTALGAENLAAASFANSLVFVAIAFIMGFSSVITPLIAASDSSKNINEGRKFLFNGLLLCTGLGIIIFGLFYCIKPFMYDMKQSENVVDLAKPFLDIAALSVVPLCVFQGLKQFTDGKSLTKYSMYATLISNVVNVFFNYVLIYGIWIFPECGLMGAAYGTLISRIVMLAYFIYIIIKTPKFKEYIQNWSLQLLDNSYISKICKLGFPSALQSIFEVCLFVSTVFMSGVLGTAEQAANQVTLSMASSTFMFACGLSVASTIRVGNMIGTKDYVQLRIIARSILMMTLILFTGFALFLILLNTEIAAYFIKENTVLDTQSLEIAAKLMIIAGLFQIVDGIQVVSQGSLKGIQDVNVPMIINFISYIVIGFGFCYYLGFYTPLGAEGIWYGILAALTVSSISLYLRFEYKSKQLIKNNA